MIPRDCPTKEDAPSPGRLRAAPPKSAHPEQRKLSSPPPETAPAKEGSGALPEARGEPETRLPESKRSAEAPKETEIAGKAVETNSKNEDSKIQKPTWATEKEFESEKGSEAIEDRQRRPGRPGEAEEKRGEPSKGEGRRILQDFKYFFKPVN